MTEIIKNIAKTLNIDVTDNYTLADVGAELNKMKNLEGFRAYIKTRFRDEDLKFSNGFQKFVTLSKEYIDLEFEEINKSRILEAKDLYSSICEKVKKISNKVLNEDREITFEMVYLGEGRLFDDEEIGILKRVGTLYQCIVIQRSVSGKDNLREKLVNNFKGRLRGEPLALGVDRKVLRMIK